MNRLSDVGYMTLVLKKLVDSKLLIDPVISGVQKEFIQSSVLGKFEKEAASLIENYWNGDDEQEIPYHLYDVILVTEKMLSDCIFHFFIGTAIYLSHDFKAEIEIDANISEMAMNDVRSFLNQHGLMNLFLCYRVIVGFESHLALYHYGKMTEKEFVHGEKHRVGASDYHESELLIGLSADYYERFEDNGEPCILLTEKGKKRMADEIDMLANSKYTNFRMRVMYVSQFDQLQDWGELIEKIVPSSISERRHFLEFLNIQQGMEVLELGCGSGLLTFEGGLAEMIGKEGWVTATDPSTGMLHQASRRLKHFGYENVSLEAAFAEQIPYDDNEFDSVLGCSFFHYTDQDKAFSEMIRVTRREGTIGLFGPLEFDFNVPFFLEWFEEIYALAKKRGVTKGRISYLAKEGEMEEYFISKGLKSISGKKVNIPWKFPDPETAVRFMAYGVGFFQEELVLLPVQARNELIQRLLRKGKEVCQKYRDEERQLPFLGYFVKGTV